MLAKLKPGMRFPVLSQDEEETWNDSEETSEDEDERESEEDEEIGTIRNVR